MQAKARVQVHFYQEYRRGPIYFPEDFHWGFHGYDHRGFQSLVQDFIDVILWNLVEDFLKIFILMVSTEVSW